MVSGDTVTEYAYPNSIGTSLALTIPNTPEFFDTNLSNWVDEGAQGGACLGGSSTRCYCLHPGGDQLHDRAQNTLYFRAGGYTVNGTVHFNNSNLRRIELADSWFNGSGTFSLEVSGSNPVQLEWGSFGITITYAGSAPVVLAHMFRVNIISNTTGSGDIYIEDVDSLQVILNLSGSQHAYLRQLDVESGQTRGVSVSGGTTWIFGYKTENVGTKLVASNGVLELLGAWHSSDCASDCSGDTYTFTNMTNFTAANITKWPLNSSLIQNNGNVVVPNNGVWGGETGLALYSTSSGK